MVWLCGMSKIPNLEMLLYRCMTCKAISKSCFASIAVILVQTVQRYCYLFFCFLDAQSLIMSKDALKRLFTEARCILENQSKAIYLVMSPNIAFHKGNPLKLSERIDASHNHQFSDAELVQLKAWEAENRVLVTNGKKWLSDWFLKVFLDEVSD